MGKNRGSMGEYKKLGGVWDSMDGEGMEEFLVVR